MYTKFFSILFLK